MTNRLKAILIFLLPVSAAVAQNDAGMWLSATISKNITQSLSVSVSEELRQMENFSEASVIFTDVGITYRLTKKLKASANYRFENDRTPDNTYRQVSKYYFDLSYRQKLSKLSVTLRERYQSKSPGFLYFGESAETKNYFRSKATLKFDPGRRLTPFVSTEWFLPLNGSGGHAFDRTRNAAGLDYQFPRGHSVELSFMTQHNFDHRDSDIFVIGLEYTLQL